MMDETFRGETLRTITVFIFSAKAKKEKEEDEDTDEKWEICFRLKA